MKNFFDELKKDHSTVKEILGKLQNTSKHAVKTREKLFSQLKGELVPHLKAEEATFYPALMETKNGRQHALEAKEEHGLTEKVFRALEETPIEEDVWVARLKVLKDLVEHHIGEEEGEIFEVAGKELKADRFPEIMKDFRQEKEKVKRELS